MIKTNKKLRNKKVLSSMFEGNTFSVNLLLVLFAVFFLTAGFDLASELAKEKNELEYILASIEESYNIPQLDASAVNEIDRPLLASLPIINQYIPQQENFAASESRGPPEA